MIDSAQSALVAAGVSRRPRSQRTVHPGQSRRRQKAAAKAGHACGREPARAHRLDVVLDGKTHHLAMRDGEKVLDTALDAGLDLPYSCRGGVCCTCRARVLEGEVEMEKNYTLEQAEIDKGFVLTCQAVPRSQRVVVSYDDR